ncbi:MAG: hypothetical protein EOO43_25115 [Flavobacterium sp.]|nr:MAG: hypothetical protein EOO43_25115 [Flavobacterium sp.]
MQNYRLPDDADVSSTNLGIDYEYNNTNYRLNPTRGNEFRIITSAGTKKVKRNNEVLYLDYDFNEISLISSSGRINIIGAFGELFLVGTPKEIIEYKKEFNNSIIFWLFEMFRRTSRIKYKHGFVIR